MTILFESDWLKYPNAIIDTKTSNKSFVRLASLYRAMGIKNCSFILALHNPLLQGVDPYDPNLTIQQQVMIGAECQENAWYFIRECVRAPSPAGEDDLPIQANRSNISLFWCFLNHIFFILIQPRQTGKSLNTDVLMVWLMSFVCRKTKINLLTKDDTLRRANVERIKAIFETLPPYLKIRNRSDVNNGEEITVNALGNRYTTHVPQSSPKNAINMGRGLTTPIFHIDEGPFQPNINLAMEAALAATGAAVDKAMASGVPYGTIMTTTAGMKDDPRGKYVYDLLAEAATWSEKYFDAVDAQMLEKLVRKASKKPNGGCYRINATFNHRQLGKDDAWLARKLEESLQKGEAADRDYFNIWTSGSMTSPFTPQQSEMMRKSEQAVLHTQIFENEGYTLRWYIPEDKIEWAMKNGQYTIGMDTSDAIGNDDVSFIIQDIETLEVVAAADINETNLIMLSKWVFDFMMRYKNCTLIPERRSSAIAIIDYLVMYMVEAGEDPFRRIFNRVVNDYDEYPERFAEINVPMHRRSPTVYTRYKKLFGFATSASGITARNDLYGITMQNAVKNGGSVMNDKRLVDQTLGLVKKNGRVDHEVGSHDDMVIGWLLNNWLLQQGKNLAFYGMRVQSIMSLITQAAALESPEQIQHRIKQQLLRERIEELSEELAKESNDYVAQHIERELLILEKRLDIEEDTVLSVAKMIHEAREKRKQSSRSRSSMSSVSDNYGMNSFGYVGHGSNIVTMR